jgi:D-glycero-alpha-D-manno-heptose-7-phosphate kinase
MIITKTPFRVSFFGGGTDYPEYFEKHGGGAVLATAIGHSAFLAVSQVYSRLFDYNLRLAYRQVECVRELDEIQHPGFRECLRYCGILRDVEVNYTAELPSFTGMGTSSTFIVGLLNALFAFQGRCATPLELAYQAIELERDIMKECVGCQDQALAALGGFNVLEFRSVRDIVVHRIPLSRERLELFEQHLLVVYTGVRRRAAEIAARQVGKIPENLAALKRMREMVDEAYHCLTGTGSLEGFGRLLDEGWRLKQSLDSGVANGNIAELYQQGLDAGAFGGKLLGAGGGGFLLFFVAPERRRQVRERLAHLEEIPLRTNAPGSHILHA